jgi:hypothetical protein
MTVEFPPSYPATPHPISKPVDVQTLQETFAALLRSYGTEKGGSQTNTLLEILRPALSDNADKNDQKQPYRENQPHTERNDFTQIDRKQQDKSEVRSGDMNTDYRNRSDRQSTLQNDYHKKIERGELPQSAMQTNTATSASSIVSSADGEPNELPPPGHPLPPQQKAGAERVGANSPPGLTLPNPAAAPNSAANNVQAGLAMPMNMHASGAIPTPAASQVTPPHAFTVFTPLGRVGQTQEKADDKEKENEEEEESVEEKPGKSKQPFAAFEAIRTETSRPLQRNRSQQPKESVVQPELSQRVVKSREKPKEAEPEHVRSVKTVEEFLNTSVQDVTVAKKGESNQPNQMQYIHRIAAACEAAAQYAPIRMKINLDHLGTLALRFSYKADKLALRFETPSKESAQFLREHLDGLKTILSKRNVKIVEIEIV